MADKENKVTKPSTGAGIDWKAMGYDDTEENTEYEGANSIKVDTGPVKFKVVAKKTYRIGFPFVKPIMEGGKQKGLEVLFKPVEHVRYFDEDSNSGVRFVMPKGNDKLRKAIIDTFSSKSVSTHYLTPVIVYDTTDEGKVLSKDAVSYSIKILAVPAGRFAKLKEASSTFNLANYDFMVTLDGDEKTEEYQKMNFKAVTKKDDLNAKTAIWHSRLVKLPEDEDEDAIKVSMAEIIKEAYDIAPTMIEVLGTRELKEAKIKDILEEWGGEADEDEDGNTESEDDDFVDEDEDSPAEESGDDDELDGEDSFQEDDAEDE